MTQGDSAGVRTIVFDIGRVLIGVDVSRAVKRFARIAGVGAFEAEFALFGPHYRRFTVGEIDGVGFHGEVCRELGRRVDYERFVEAWCDMFSELPEMEPLVATLSHRFPIYLCSNTDPLHFEHLRTTAPILSFARGAVLSYEVRREKPDPAIYQALLARFALDPATTLFIDDREENVAGAAAVGMTGLVFDGVEDLRTDLVEMRVLPG
jgi:HAD superfamily hydrolase (TIGR01509 family)